MKFFEDSSKSDPRGKDEIETMMYALFNQFKEVPKELPSKYLSPSSLNCPVAGAFKLQGAPVIPEKSSFRSRSFADNGNDRHNRIQEFLSETDMWVNIADYIKDKNLPLEIVEQQGHEVLLLSEHYKTRFRCDGMLLINGEYYILEIKTERGSVTASRTHPDEKHYKQGVTYTLLLDANNILWVYEGRDNLEQKPFVQVISKSEKANISNYISDIISNMETPEKLTRNLKACTYCPYKNYCKMYFNEIRKKEFQKWTGKNK